MSKMMRILSFFLAIAMLFSSVPVVPAYAQEEEPLSVGMTNPFRNDVSFTIDGQSVTSNSYRIPSMVTLADGTIVAAADIRWNTTYDGGGLDTLVARSTDGGKTWTYNVANYLGDNGNVYNSQSTTFIDPNLLVAADGQTVYMLVDLYAYGVALNGNGSHIQPVVDTGFDANGNLKLSDDSHYSYNYYLKDGKIYNSSNNVVEGYEVDAYFNITYTQKGEIKKSNLFYYDSPFKVARTQYLYLTKSTDGGATWSEPNLLDVRAKAKVAATENALLVSPGNSITTSGGIMVYPVYSYKTDGTQHVALIYSRDGVNWERSADYTALNWSSEGAIVELENGNIRVFVRNKTKHLCYVDFDVRTMTWIGHKVTEVPTNSNTQLSAITYSKTSNGDQVVLISCPTGPNGAGSDNNDGSYRTNGKLHVFTVNAAGEMTLEKTVDVFKKMATAQIPGSNYTEADGFFAYSCLNELADGSIALLYENNQFGWGAGDKLFYTITNKGFSTSDLGVKLDRPETVVVDANGNYVSNVTIDPYEKVVLTAKTSYPTADVDYQWQIADKDGNWIDIYGEDDADLTVSISLVATLLDNDSVNVRCVTSTGARTITSGAVAINVDFSNLDNGDSDEPVAPTLDILKNGVNADSVTVTYGNKSFTATLTAETTLIGSLTYQWEVLADAANDHWDTLSTEEICTFGYEDLQFKHYDTAIDIATVRLTVSNGTESLTDTFVVYRIAEVYVKNSAGNETGTVDVTVSGVLPADANLNLGDASDTIIGGVEEDEIALALDVTITQNGVEWQPAEGETVRVTVPASQLGLVDGQYFTVYHIHDGTTELIGPFVVDNGYVTFDIDGFSIVVITTNYGAALGAVADIVGSYIILDSSPEDFTGTYVRRTDFPVDRVVIKNFCFDDEYGQLYFEIDAAPGYTWPEKYADRHWCYSDALTNIDVDGVMGIFDENDQPASFVELATSAKPTFTVKTSLTGDVQYQWQLCYDVSNQLWADISGETAESITLSYAMLSGVLDGGICAVRCTVSNALKTQKGYPLVIAFTEPAAEPAAEATEEPVVEPTTGPTETVTVAKETIVASASFSSKRKAAPAAESDSNTVLVTVQFVMGSDTVAIENGYFTYQVPKNGNLTEEVTIPVVEGYAAYLENDRDIVYSDAYALNLTNVTEDMTITFRFWPAEVSYKVVYMQQNIFDDGYTVVRTDDKTGLTGSDPVVDSVAYDGFVYVWSDTDKIASDGSTVIEVRYDRLYFKMLFDLDGGYGVQPVYARYGTPISVNNPTKAGYIFLGWNAVNGPYSDDDDETVDIETFADIEIPTMHTNYTALWQASESSKVTVVVWGQNPDDDNYSFMAAASKDLFFNSKPGTSVTYNPNGGYICGYTDEHIHGTGDCTLSCTRPEHTHEENCVEIICGQIQHTSSQHTDDCLTCDGLQYHSISCYQSTLGTLNTNSVTDRTTLYYLNSGYAQTTNGGLYNVWGSYYFKFGDSYYQVTGANNNTRVELKNDCGHTNFHDAHDESCYGCHVHMNDCYRPCSLQEHAHTGECYSGCTKEEHTHGAGCRLNINGMSSNLWTFSHADTVTVAADGSTTLNVYFNRTKFTITFKDNGTVYTINERWGTNISSHWPIKGSKGTYDSGERWDPSGSNTFDQVLVYIDIMPAENFTLTVDRSNHDTYIMHYMVEVPTGASYTDDYRHNGVTKYFVEYKEVRANYNFVTEAEDFISLQGFTKWISNPTFKNNQIDINNGGDVYFYYTRNSYNIVLDNYGTTFRSEMVQYEASLEKFAGDGYKVPAVQAPDVYQPGSVTFKGWYLAPQTPNDFNFENAEPFDFANSEMPASDLKLYAWWEPVTHKVTFYYDRDAFEAGTVYTEDGEEQIFQIPHGSKIPNPPTNPTSEYYEFEGWVYLDENGTENLWDFDNSTVTGDVKLYGKWKSTTPAEYVVKFVTYDKDGNEIQIADPFTGMALGGSNKTFDAKLNGDLYEGYQQRYYPHVMSHGITINIADPSKNTFTFVYDYVECTSYTVKYVNEETGEPMLVDKVVNNNTHAMVTETFVPIPGYLPDDYMKSIKIDPKGSNEIVFYYHGDKVNGIWTLHYWLENADGTYTEATSMQTSGTANAGSTVTAPTDTEIANYYYYAEHPSNVSSGTVSIEKVTHLHMYYNRTVHDYTVQYLEEGTNKPLADKKVVSGTKWGSLVEENAIAIENYTVSGDASKTLEVSVDETKNLITFYYVENKVTLNYLVVGPDGCGTVTPESEEVKIMTGTALGSQSKASSNVYKFVGWYSDADCKTLLSTNAFYQPTKDADKPWIDDTTYYAKFEYNFTSLTITKVTTDENGNVMDYSAIDPNQTFIFDVIELDENDAVVNILTVTIHGQGSITIDGLTVGNRCTITEKTDWSWRYGGCTPTINDDLTGKVNGSDAEVVLTHDATINTVSFANERTENQWLDGDSWCNNIFK